MRSGRPLAWLAVLLVGAACVAGNLWFAARRSMIPMALDTYVEDRWTACEKHPGRDDVWVVILPGGHGVEVDERPWRLCEKGKSIEKEAWEKTLSVNGRPVALAWSNDARGMAVVMPFGLLLLAAALVYGGSGRRNTNRSTT